MLIKACIVKVMGFPSSYITDVGIGLWKNGARENWRSLNCSVGELLRTPYPARRSVFGLLGRDDTKVEILVLWLSLGENWLFGKNRVAETHWGQEETVCWAGCGEEGEGDYRGWNGWMASPTRWTGLSVNSGSWWWTGRPGVLRFMGLQRVGHDWATELNCSQDCDKHKINTCELFFL